MVACDQSFKEVEKAEFIVAMSYGRTGKFMLPKWDGVQRWVMKLGEENIEYIKAMFSLLIFVSRLWRERLVFHLMLGHLVTAMLS